MGRLIVKENITSRGALASGQALQLGDFPMIARSASEPARMTSRVIEKCICVDSEYAKQMDPTELSSLNELPDRIAALGVATDYNRIGLKPGQREINSPPITHQIAVVEEQDNPSSTLRTNYVRISDLEKPDTNRQKDTPCPPNLESDSRLQKSEDTLEPGLFSLEKPQTLDHQSGQGSNPIPPTHPDISALTSTKQQSRETFHHLWARFLIVKDKVKDCRDEDAISAFRNNCTNKGLLNAINPRHILHFADLATIVQKYSAMESAWRDHTVWELSAPTQPLVQTKGCTPVMRPDQ